MNERLLLLLLTTGCAFATVTVTPPTESVATGLSGGAHRTVQLEIPFADQRPTPNRCGMQKNSYNFETAEARCSAEPRQWLAELLAGELSAAGFDVVSTPAPGALRLKATLLQFYVEPVVGAFTFTPEADIHVRLVASSDSGLLAERSFYVKGEEISLVGREQNFQLAVNDSVRSALREMVAAVIALADRYPALGRKGTP